MHTQSLFANFSLQDSHPNTEFRARDTRSLLDAYCTTVTILVGHDTLQILRSVNMSCINFCCCTCCCRYCSFCCERCNPQAKYAHVEYSTPEEANKLPPFSERLFPVLDFTRREGGFRLHPQPAPSPKDVVTTQPTYLHYPQFPSPTPPKHVVTAIQPPLQRKHLYPPISSQTSPKRRPLSKALPTLQKQRKELDECSLPDDDLQLLVCDMKDEGPFTYEQLATQSDRGSPKRFIEQPQMLPIVLNFSLCYDIQLHTLGVHLHNASNLPTTSSLGSVNPFFVLFLLPSKEEIIQTATFKIKTSNPCFDTMCTFHAVTMTDVHQLILVIQVFDRDRLLKDHLIGTVTMPLKEADLYGSVPVTKMVIERKDIEVVKVGVLYHSCCISEPLWDFNYLIG